MSVLFTWLNDRHLSQMTCFQGVSEWISLHFSTLLIATPEPGSFMIVMSYAHHGWINIRYLVVI